VSSQYDFQISDGEEELVNDGCRGCGCTAEGDAVRASCQASIKGPGMDGDLLSEIEVPKADSIGDSLVVL
jgi:hypothetical protein